MQPALERYAFSLKHPAHGRRAKADSTVTAYCESARRFDAFMLEMGGDYDQATVEAFVRDLEEVRHVAPATVGRHLDGLRSYFMFKGKAFDLANPQVRRKIPYYLKEEEWDRLFAVATRALREPTAQPPDVRKALFLRAAIMAYFGAGLRLSEGVNLKVRDVDASGFLRVLGKGNKEGVVAVEDEVVTALKEWIKLNPGSVYVFPGKQPGTHISSVWMDQVMKTLFRRAGLPEEVHVHTLRHSFGAYLRSKRVPLRTIQDQLRHSKVETTVWYTQGADEERRDEILKAGQFRKRE